MPELPEVETIRRGLEKLILSRQIKAVKSDNMKSFPNSDAEVSEFIIGAHVKAVSRRAKVLIIDLDTDYSLVVHLKMTGQMVYRGEQNFGAGHPNDSLVGHLPDRSTRVTITFDDGSHLFFNDQRKFGWMKLFPTIEVSNIDFMRRVGPEPLDPKTTDGEIISRIRRRNGTTVKAAVLDQSVIAGIGNIYADEALWGAKIHPMTRVRDLNDEQLKKLFSEARTVLALSIEKGGSTDRNYIDATGKRGSYLEFAKVFRRQGQACPRCGEIIEKIRVAARGTHICPRCQSLT